MQGAHCSLRSLGVIRQGDTRRDKLGVDMWELLQDEFALLPAEAGGCDRTMSRRRPLGACTIHILFTNRSFQDAFMSLSDQGTSQLCRRAKDPICSSHLLHGDQRVYPFQSLVGALSRAGVFVSRQGWLYEQLLTAVSSQ